MMVLFAATAFVTSAVCDDLPVPEPPATGAAGISISNTGVDSLMLDLGTDTAHCGRVLRLLAADRVRVARADTGADGEMTVRVSVTARQFRESFRGRLAIATVARSADSGFVDVRLIEGYVIPRRYRGCLRWIRLPDPQLE
ncbi:MAG: hypothetical protein MUF78_00145 [Candidatus Edwardsbacteria bacterium]|jgi:hypothetical protein|nr:hypothetical protein [Candidatus Edwardsbacteria bacterium]